MELYKYHGKIIKVYDGDTVTMQVDLGFNVSVVEKIRLHGINAPEVRGMEKVKGKESRDYLRSLVLHKKVFVQTIKDKKGKYGRYLGILYVRYNDYLLDVNKHMVSKGYAEEKEY